MAERRGGRGGARAEGARMPKADHAASLAVRAMTEAYEFALDQHARGELEYAELLLARERYRALKVKMNSDLATLAAPLEERFRKILAEAKEKEAMQAELASTRAKLERANAKLVENGLAEVACAETNEASTPGLMHNVTDEDDEFMTSPPFLASCDQAVMQAMGGHGAAPALAPALAPAPAPVACRHAFLSSAVALC